DIHSIEVLAAVAIEQVFAVRTPHRGELISATTFSKLFGWRRSILLLYVQFIRTGTVGNKTDPMAVGTPTHVPVVGSTAMRQVARYACFGRYGKHVPTRAEDRPLPVG